MKIFEYCPICKHKSVKEMERLPKTVKLGTDGWGQPVRFADCDCGKLKGFFQLGFYISSDTELDEDLRFYLMHRIDFYNAEMNK